MSQHQQSIETIGVTVGKVASVGGGAAGLVFGLTANEVAALAGIVIGVLGLLVQWHYNRQRNRREVAEHEARMARWRKSAPGPGSSSS